MSVVSSIIVNILHNKLPPSNSRLYRYGKIAEEEKHFLSDCVEVPKEWFKHFYVFASILSAFQFLLVVHAFVFELPIPEFVIHFLDVVDNCKNRPTAYNATAATIAMSCMMIHCWKRYYETHYLSIFSKSKMNILYYTLGFVHYFCCITSILAEAPSPFTSASPAVDHRSHFLFNDINIRLIIGITIFLCAAYQQYLANVILVNLRKNEDGKIMTYKYKIPSGGLFDIISCPHMFCEVLIYMAICIILWGSRTWPYIFAWVLINQCECAMVNHWWYKSKSETYPKVRRAIIPYIM